MYQNQMEWVEAQMLAKSQGQKISLPGARPAEQPYRTPHTWWASGLGAAPGLESPPRRQRVTWYMLREIPLRNPIFAAIEKRFARMAAQFLVRQPDRDSLGFRVALRDRRRNMTAAAQCEADRIEELILRGGIPSQHPGTGEWAVWNSDFTEKADSFPRFLQKFLLYRLRFDMAAIRIEPGENARKYPIAFYRAIDGSRLRKAQPKDRGAHNQGSYLPPPYRPELRPQEQIAWVLLGPDYETTPGGIVREFRWDEVALEPQNPSEDPWCEWIGTPENEYCLDVMTGILYGIDFNLSYFDSNHIPEGFLVLKGMYGGAAEGGGGDDPRIQAFRRWLMMNVGGMGKMWSIPILSVNPNMGEQSPEFIKFRENPGDAMYWKEWLLFCGSVAAAVYGLQAGELNFASFGQSRNPLSTENLEEKIEYSTNTAFVPLMEYLAEVFSRVLVQRLNPDFEWQWVNLRPRSQEQHRLIQAHRISTGLTTIAEERTLEDLPPIRDPLDRDLWHKIYVQAEQEEAKLKEDDEDAWLQYVSDAYEKAGGKFALWPSAPQGPLLQVWMMEHGIGGSTTPPEGEERERDEGAEEWMEEEPSEEEGEIQKAVGKPRRGAVGAQRRCAPTLRPYGQKIIEVRIRRPQQ